MIKLLRIQFANNGTINVHYCRVHTSTKQITTYKHFFYKAIFLADEPYFICGSYLLEWKSSAYGKDYKPWQPWSASPRAQWQIPQSPRTITSFCRTPRAVHENRSSMMLGFGQWGNGCGGWEKEVQSRTLLLRRRWRPRLRPRHRLDPHCSSSSMDTPPSQPRRVVPHGRRCGQC